MPSCWSPGWCLGTQHLCPGRGMWLPPSHLQVQPAVKLSPRPRDTRTDTHGMRTRSDTRTATGEALPSTVPPCRTCLEHDHRQSPPFLCLGWQTQKVASAGTHTRLSGCTSTCTFTAPLSARYPCRDPSTLAHLRGRLLAGWSGLMLPTNA